MIRRFAWFAACALAVVSGAAAQTYYPDRLDWQNDLVIVVRWITGSALNEFIGKVLAALE